MQNLKQLYKYFIASMSYDKSAIVALIFSPFLIYFFSFLSLVVFGNSQDLILFQIGVSFVPLLILSSNEVRLSKPAFYAFFPGRRNLFMLADSIKTSFNLVAFFILFYFVILLNHESYLGPLSLLTLAKTWGFFVGLFILLLVPIYSMCLYFYSRKHFDQKSIVLHKALFRVAFPLCLSLLILLVPIFLFLDSWFLAHKHGGVWLRLIEEYGVLKFGGLSALSFVTITVLCIFSYWSFARTFNRYSLTKVFYSFVSFMFLMIFSIFYIFWGLDHKSHTQDQIKALSKNELHYLSYLCEEPKFDNLEMNKETLKSLPLVRNNYKKCHKKYKVISELEAEKFMEKISAWIVTLPTHELDPLLDEAVVYENHAMYFMLEKAFKGLMPELKLRSFNERLIKFRCHETTRDIASSIEEIDDLKHLESLVKLSNSRACKGQAEALTTQYNKIQEILQKNAVN